MAVNAELENGVSLHMISQNASVPYSTLYRWISEQRDIKLSTADALSNYLGLTLVPIADVPAKKAAKKNPAKKKTAKKRSK